MQVRGTVTAVEDADEKAAALQALMQKYQPEGGHQPIRADDPLYRKAVSGVLVLRLPIDAIDGKAKLWAEPLAGRATVHPRKLWQRGLIDDPRAIDLVATRLVERHGASALPDFLRGPRETRGCTALLALPMPTKKVGLAARCLLE